MTRKLWGKDSTTAVSRSDAAFKTMEFNMDGKAIARAFLILALIVTAHLIRPFSIKNVTQHLLYSARSFSFILPDQLREKFDHANHLAVNLSNSLFEADEGIRDFTRGMTADLAFRPIDIQPLDEVNKSATKQKPCPKKSAPAKRVNRTEKKGVSDQPTLSGLVAIARRDEIRLVELPPARLIDATVAPVVSSCLTKIFTARITGAAHVRPIETALPLWKKDCERREWDQKTRVARIKDETGAKSSIWLVEKTGVGRIGLGVSECEDQPAAIVAEAVEIEIMKSDADAPQTDEELRASQFSAPFAKCSKEP